MVEDAVKAVLATDPDVAAIVAARIWPLLLPQSAVLPAIVYQRISTTPGSFGLRGPLGPTRSRLQLSCWATTFGTAHQLGAAIIGALNGWSGVAGGEPVQLVRLVNWLDDHEPGPPERFRVIADFNVLSMEGVAA